MQLTLPRRRPMRLDRPVLVGVLNVTPDSFSDGGAYEATGAAVEQARAMIEAGADVIDVGGESTRPGAERVTIEEQLRRVLPTIEELAERFDVPISIDTTRSAVAAAALDAGASILNDVSAGQDDEQMLALAAERGSPIVLMHMQGEPATMQQRPTYGDVVSEVRGFLLERAAAAMDAGVPKGQIVLDPGIGFGKTLEHNLTLLANLPTLVETGHPVLLGTSRKRFLGTLSGMEDPTRRDVATAATTALGVAAGVQLFRVHDVLPNRHAADVAFAIESHRR